MQNDSNIGQRNLSKTRPGLSKCKVILSQSVRNHGCLGLKVFWFKKTIYFHNDSHPDTTHKHVFCILKTSRNSSHKRQKAQIRLYSVGIELALYNCKSSPLYEDSIMEYKDWLKFIRIAVCSHMPPNPWYKGWYLAEHLPTKVCIMNVFLNHVKQHFSIMIAFQKQFINMFLTYWMHEVIQTVSIKRPKSGFTDWELNSDYISAKDPHCVKFHQRVWDMKIYTT